ncbi:CDP-diacylglycerol--glycerol-3-phosphate 3-phosphatidyltransferase [Minicystis rosea]|nr:CDP-diacylglycerol--glycerol-3-phosphate 3-phosphatidyltransferase [Minicystis rosea]
MHAHAPPGFFSRRELLLAPNVLSFLRLPLALAFPIAARSKGQALSVLALAGLTDVLDGFIARVTRQVTSTGAVLDPIADKVFATSVVATLLARGQIPAWGIPALLAREILEAPLLAWGLVARPHEERDVTEVRANVPGKLATVAQFTAVMAAIEAPALLPAALVASAAAGTIAGVMYWRRELDRARAPKASEAPRTSPPAVPTRR